MRGKVWSRSSSFVSFSLQQFSRQLYNLSTSKWSSIWTAKDTCPVPERLHCQSSVCQRMPKIHCELYVGVLTKLPGVRWPQPQSLLNAFCSKIKKKYNTVVCFFFFFSENHENWYCSQDMELRSKPASYFVDRFVCLFGWFWFFFGASTTVR